LSSPFLHKYTKLINARSVQDSRSRITQISGGRGVDGSVGVISKLEQREIAVQFLAGQGIFFSFEMCTPALQFIHLFQNWYYGSFFDNNTIGV
jgi:hypothetical protein